jgi:replicative DNA helicase
MADRYDELAARSKGVVISTRLTDLDFRLGGGFYDGDFVILGSRPSAGKTTLLQFLAKSIARERKVLFCSGEMSIESISDRDVAALTGEHISTIRLGDYSDDLRARIIDAWGELSEREVYYYEDAPLTVAKVMQAATTMKLRYGLGAVFVDYIGMLDDEYGQGEYERISFISRRLKQLSRKLNVPLIAAHQLNRKLEEREDKRPQLYDLRGSGKLEEDADTVLFLYRDDYYYTKEDWEQRIREQRIPDKVYPQGIVEILIAKQRQGEANRLVKVLYEPSHQAYLDLKKEGAP